MRVWLIKPATDVRDGEDIIRSRIGLSATCDALDKQADIFALFKAHHKDCNVIIADECQFFTHEQVDQMRRVVDECKIPVLCFGLRTDFMTRLFPGSLRLFEVADSIAEIKTICECGSKAIVNARIDKDGNVLTAGKQVLLGGNDRYIAMCHKCWRKKISERN